MLQVQVVDDEVEAGFNTNPLLQRQFPAAVVIAVNKRVGQKAFKIHYTGVGGF